MVLNGLQHFVSLLAAAGLILAAFEPRDL